MTFANRVEAGRQLAKKLSDFFRQKDVIVLGIPRGGVPVAFQIASRLGAPLDIFLSRKLGVPGHEELAFGAVAAGDGRYLDESVIEAAGITAAEMEQVTQRVKQILEERATLYRGDQPPLDVSGKTVILVDDGIATGASVYAAVSALRPMKPTMIVLAVPVMPLATRAWLEAKVDRLVCLYAPDNFYAVGQFYLDFEQVTDAEVINLLQEARKREIPSAPTHRSDIYAQEVSIDLGATRLCGTLTVPTNSIGLILFVHGNGSSRHSPRNQFVAQILQSSGLATLLFDLLTDAEEGIDEHTSQYRFDIQLLAERLVNATHWIRRVASVQSLPIGYFGASTGAAAALIAAARLPNQIAAVVSRGGRPDLAGDYLQRVRASVLLVVGGNDEVVLGLNQKALRQLSCRDKQLVVVPKATHLFEEKGTLEEAAHHAADWFTRTLKQSHASADQKSVHAASAP